MTATDELRRMLDERRVEWTANDGEHVKETCWPYMGELMAAFAEYDNGTTRFACDTWCFTPEQAITATLGRGECHMRLVYEEEDADGFIWPDHYECNACGANVNGIMPSYDTEIQPRFCPACGRKVVDA